MRDRSRPLLVDDPGVVTVSFPLRGEWRAPHTPAQRVPSHGSDLWAQTYAYDLWRTEPERPGAFHRRSGLRYWTRGVHLSDCYGQRAPVHAAFSGTVVRAGDHVVDRDRLHPVLDLLRILRNAVGAKPHKSPWAMIGNHAVVAHETIDECFALYAHLAHGSLRVAVGDRVEVGEEIGEVGHTGNSTAPHLHFQLMTTADPRTAQGVPCAFADIEVMGTDGAWVRTGSIIPHLHQRVRSASTAEVPHATG